MKFNLTILSSKFLKGWLPFDWQAFVSLLAKNGDEVESVSCKCEDGDINFDTNTIVLADNDKIDDIILKNLNFLSNDKQVLDDLAVKFNVDGKTVIFLPIDVKDNNLLEKALKKQENGIKTCKFHVFGKTPEQVEELLKQVDDVKTSVVGSNLLTCAYARYSGDENLVDDTQIKISNLLRENLFSENDLGLSESVCSLLNLKNAKIAICEGITSGKILSRLGQSPNFAAALKEGRVECEQNIDSEKLYGKALKLLKDSLADVVLVTHGQFDDKGLSSLMAIGDKNSISIYKNRFNGGKADCIEMATNCALYHLLKKLRQNDFAF